MIGSIEPWTKTENNLYENEIEAVARASTLSPTQAPEASQLLKVVVAVNLRVLGLHWNQNLLELGAGAALELAQWRQAKYRRQGPG